MKAYYIICKRNTASKNPSVRRTRHDRFMLLSNCEMCFKKNLRFITYLEASRLLSKLVIRTPLANIPLIGDILL